MQQQLVQLTRGLRRTVASWVSARVQESRHCTDCDAVVSPFDNVCPQCGLSNPARVRISPLVYAGLGLAVLAIIAVVKVV